MAQLFIVPTSLLEATPPHGTWHAILTPGDKTRALVVVETWESPEHRDAWEDSPGVAELHAEDLRGPIATPHVALFAPWGVKPGDSLRDSLRTIRGRWPAARH